VTEVSGNAVYEAQSHAVSKNILHLEQIALTKPRRSSCCNNCDLYLELCEEFAALHQV